VEPTSDGIGSTFDVCELNDRCGREQARVAGSRAEVLLLLWRFLKKDGSLVTSATLGVDRADVAG
jgi:hypothetical protein